MTEKVIDYNKSEINMSPIKEWKDLEGTEFLELLISGAELDAELYELAVKKVPQLVKQSKLVLKSSHKTMKQAMKSSKRTKKYYYKVSKAIMKLLKRDDIAHELKLELIELLKEFINLYVMIQSNRSLYRIKIRSNQILFEKVRL